jgi:hypothetical protein
MPIVDVCAPDGESLDWRVARRARKWTIDFKRVDEITPARQCELFVYEIKINSISHSSIGWTDQELCSACWCMTLSLLQLLAPNRRCVICGYW